MSINYSLLRYPGGKSQVYGYVKELIKLNSCDTYIEPFMGGAGVALKLLLNGDVKRVLLNDYDKSIYAFWFSVLNYTEELILKIEETEITVEEWYIQKEIQNNKGNIDDLLVLGFSTLYLNRTNRSGILNAGMIGGKRQNGEYKLDCRFNKIALISRIREISKHKKKIKLYNMDASLFIRMHITKTKRSFTFFDPPYYKKGPILYTNFYNHKDHVDLAVVINKYMQNKLWILTYDNEIEVFDMYKTFEYKMYYLRYSISSSTKGIEYMFFSKLLNKGNTEEYLKISNFTNK